MKKFIKIFGYEENALREVLDRIFTDASMAEYQLFSKYLDSKVVVEGEFDSDIDKYLLTIYDVFGGAVYCDEDKTLEECVVEFLTLYGKTVGTAESLTGGALASKIVDVAGASKVFHSGIVSYSNKAKVDYLGISELTLNSHGAVSAEVCYQMAQGLLTDPNLSYGVSTTGLASSGGEESPEKPVGLVYIGIADEVRCEVFKYQFEGTRQEIRIKTVNSALFRLLERIKRPVDFSNMVVN